MEDKHTDGTVKSYIVQRYLSKPLLYQKRKFDLRHYLLLTRIGGNLRAYWSL